MSVRGSPGSPSYWRMLAADTYDGERWTSSAALRPIGDRLGPSSPDDVAVRLRYETGTIDLVPLPGEPVTIDADVTTDVARAYVRLDQPPVAGDVVAATVRPFETATADTATVRSRPIDPQAAELSSLARNMIGEGDTTKVQQLRALESTLPRRLSAGGLDEQRCAAGAHHPVPAGHEAGHDRAVRLRLRVAGPLARHGRPGGGRVRRRAGRDARSAHVGDGGRVARGVRRRQRLGGVLPRARRDHRRPGNSAPGADRDAGGPPTAVDPTDPGPDDGVPGHPDPAPAGAERACGRRSRTGRSGSSAAWWWSSPRS